MNSEEIELKKEQAVDNIELEIIDSILELKTMGLKAREIRAIFRNANSMALEIFEDQD